MTSICWIANSRFAFRHPYGRLFFFLGQLFSAALCDWGQYDLPIFPSIMSPRASFMVNHDHWIPSLVFEKKTNRTSLEKKIKRDLSPPTSHTRSTKPLSRKNLFIAVVKVSIKLLSRTTRTNPLDLYPMVFTITVMIAIIAPFTNAHNEHQESGSVQGRRLRTPGCLLYEIEPRITGLLIWTSAVRLVEPTERWYVMLGNDADFKAYKACKKVHKNNSAMYDQQADAFSDVICLV